MLLCMGSAQIDVKISFKDRQPNKESTIAAAGHGNDVEGPLFRPLKNPTGQGNTDQPLTHGAVYHLRLEKTC
jgi:hypothetical protein